MKVLFFMKVPNSCAAAGEVPEKVNIFLLCFMKRSTQQEFGFILFNGGLVECCIFVSLPTKMCNNL